jgi:uncharacterized protein
MIGRALQATIEESLKADGCALLVGPYEVGKSVLARAIARDFGVDAHCFNGRDERDRLALGGDDGLLRNSAGKLIVIDEVHGFPDFFDMIHVEIEAARRGGGSIGRFLLLGSSSIDAAQLAARTLGTRIETFRLSPIGLSELRDESEIEFGEARTLAPQDVEATAPVARANIVVSLEQLWLRGGFPESLLATAERQSLAWRQRYLNSLCARGYGHLNPGLSAPSVREFLERLALLQGETINLDKIRVEQRPLIAHFEGVGLVRRLRPWHPNERKRFERESKMYIRDSGLLHCLLKRRSLGEVKSDASVYGHSWEGFCVENLILAAGDAVIPLFYRSDTKDEVDLILEYPTGDRWAIEIKGVTAKVKPGFDIAADEIRATRRIVVRPIPESVEHAGRRILTLRDAIATVSRGPSQPN